MPENSNFDSIFVQLATSWVAKVFAIVIAVGGFYNLVIIPLNEIKLQLVSIQLQMADYKQGIVDLQLENNSQTKAIDRNTLLIDQLVNKMK